MKIRLTIIFILALFVFSGGVTAQTNHTSEHVAFAQAVNNELGADCVSITRTGYNVVSGSSIARFSIDVVVDKACALSALGVVPETVSATLSWSAPTKREDGSTIKPGDLATYTILHNEKSYEVPAAQTSYKLALGAGQHSFYISVSDVYGMESDLSEEERVSI